MIGTRMRVGRPSAPRAYRPAGRRGLGAFTLIELLIVITIIALLVTILAPSLQTAMKLAVNVKCKANLKRLGQAFRARADSKAMPSPWGWLSVASAAGAADVTTCPLGGYEDGGTGARVSTSGSVVSISAPPSVVFDDFESSTNPARTIVILDWLVEISMVDFLRDVV